MNWRDNIVSEISEKGYTQRSFCRVTGLYPSELNNIIKKNRSLSIKVALALENEGIKTAEYWLTLQLKEQIEYSKKSYAIHNYR